MKKTLWLVAIVMLIIVSVLYIHSREFDFTLHTLTDEELIRQMTASGALEIWALQSTHHPSTEEGLNYLLEISDEFQELSSRGSGMSSLAKHGPTIVKEFLQAKDHTTVQGLHLAKLITLYHPSLDELIDGILSQYSD